MCFRPSWAESDFLLQRLHLGKCWKNVRCRGGGNNGQEFTHLVGPLLSRLWYSTLAASGFSGRHG